MLKKENQVKTEYSSVPNCFSGICDHFKINIKKLYWIDGSQDNKEDLCLHGDLEIRLNEQIIEYSPTVSAAGLNLLRSLKTDHQAGKGAELFPCCGNTMLANEDRDKVEIIGCDSGLDWSVKHKLDLVTIEIDDSFKITCSYSQYKNEVFKFIKQIEDFYKKSENRILPEDKIDREGYLAFWKEWDGLKKV